MIIWFIFLFGENHVEKTTNFDLCSVLDEYNNYDKNIKGNMFFQQVKFTFQKISNEKNKHYHIYLNNFFNVPFQSWMIQLCK